MGEGLHVRRMMASIDTGARARTCRRDVYGGGGITAGGGIAIGNNMQRCHHTASPRTAVSPSPSRHHGREEKQLHEAACDILVTRTVWARRVRGHSHFGKVVRLLGGGT
jgi:hypothetical protein